MLQPPPQPGLAGQAPPHYPSQKTKKKPETPLTDVGWAAVAPPAMFWSFQFAVSSGSVTKLSAQSDIAKHPNPASEP